MVGGSAGSDVIIGLNIFKFWDWSKLENEDISDMFSHGVEVAFFSFADDISIIVVDFVNISKGVAESFFEKSGWILEDGRPDFDSLDIWSNTFAINKIGLEGTNHLSNLRDTCNDAHGVFLFEIINGFNQLWFKNFLILEAWLNFLEFVIMNKSIKESSYEVENLVVAEFGMMMGNSGCGKEFGN